MRDIQLAYANMEGLASMVIRRCSAHAAGRRDAVSAIWYNKIAGLAEGIAAGQAPVEESPHSTGRRCRLTAGQGNLTASATESRLRRIRREGERVR